MAEAWQIGSLLTTTTKFLGDKGSSTPRLDAELLLARVLKTTKIQLYVNFSQEVTPSELNEYRELVRRRAAAEPVAYIVGEREFYGLRFKTTPAALIPRPETEHLVDAALHWAQDLWPNESLEIADIGCGSGAISLALAKNLPRSKVDAVDISKEALALAHHNATALNLADRVSFHEGNLLAPLASRTFHLVCANLPYIPTSEMAGLMPDVGLHEPHLALDGGQNGLAPIAHLLAEVVAHLHPKGLVLLEIWPDSLAELEKIAAHHGLVPAEEVIRDLAGHPRIVVLKILPS